MTRLMSRSLIGLIATVLLVSGAAAEPATPSVEVGASPVGTGAVVVNFSSEASPVKDACYGAVVTTGPGQIHLLASYACDADDGANDGSTHLDELPVGQSVAIYVAQFPERYVRLPFSQVVEVEPGNTVTRFYTTDPACVWGQSVKCATVTIEERETPDPADTVCYAMFLPHDGAPGNFATLACDPPSPGEPPARFTTFRGIVPGDYFLVRIGEDGTPTGDPVPLPLPGDKKDVTITWPDA